MIVNWVPVTERLPLKSVSYLDGSIGSGYFEANEVLEWLDGLNE